MAPQREPASLGRDSCDGEYPGWIVQEHGTTERVLASMAVQTIRTRSRFQMIAPWKAFGGRHVGTNSPCWRAAKRIRPSPDLPEVQFALLAMHVNQPPRKAANTVGFAQ